MPKLRAARGEREEEKVGRSRNGLVWRRQLRCSARGFDVLLLAQPESKVANAYGATSATEQYFCNFGVDPARVEKLKSGPMRVSGSDAEGVIRVIEWPDHPFFVGTLYVPQSRSLPGKPHPLVSAFVRAAVARQKRRASDSGLQAG